MRIPVPPPPGPTVAAAHTYKSRGVVVPGGLGIPESLQHRVCLYDLILQGPLPGEKHQVGWPVGHCVGTQGFPVTVAFVPGIGMGTGLGAWEIGAGGDLGGGLLPDDYPPAAPDTAPGRW